MVTTGGEVGTGWERLDLAFEHSVYLEVLHWTSYIQLVCIHKNMNINDGHIFSDYCIHSLQSIWQNVFQDIQQKPRTNSNEGKLWQMVRFGAWHTVMSSERTWGLHDILKTPPYFSLYSPCSAVRWPPVSLMLRFVSVCSVPAQGGRALQRTHFCRFIVRGLICRAVGASCCFSAP